MIGIESHERWMPMDERFMDERLHVVQKDNCEDV